MVNDRIIVAGFGGQGALRIGQMIAYAAINQGLEAEWLPSYGAEMRGGTANCSVTITDDEVVYPMFDIADCCIIMNDASLDKFGGRIKEGGMLLLNSDIVTKEAGRTDITIYNVPSDTIAEEGGNKRGSNMVLLGAYIAVKGGIELESIYDIIRHSFTGSKAKFVDSNIALVKAGYDYIKEHY